MMKNILYKSTILLGFLAFCACNPLQVEDPLPLPADFSDPIYPKTYGRVSVAAEVISDVEKPIATTKSNDLLLEFYFDKPEGGSLKCLEYPKVSEMPSVTLLPIGSYKVIAKSHAEMPTVGNYAYFEGSTTFTVTETEAVMGKIEVKMVNAKLGIELDDSFKAAFSSWNVKLVYRDIKEASHEFSADASEAVYVAARPFDLVLSAIQNVDEKEFKKVMPCDNVVGGANVVVKLTGNTIGSLKLAMTVNDQVVTNDHLINFPDDDKELGGGGNLPDQPQAGGLLEVVGDGFDVDVVKTLSISKDFNGTVLKVPLKVTVNAEDGIRLFMINIDSPDIGADLLVPLFGDTKFDLANVPAGSDLELNLNQLGILPTGTPVKDQPTFTFDLTSFMGLLPVNVKTHNFELTVQDANRASVTKVIKILIVN